MKKRQAHCWNSHRSRAAFVLIEVVVAMAILGTAIAMLMRGFTTAMRSVQYNQVSATALVLADRLMTEYELIPPAEGSDEGDFGEEFPLFFWRREVWAEEIDYDDPRAGVADNELDARVRVRLKIYYMPRDRPAQLALDLQTALTRFERFSHQTRLRCGLYPTPE